jgi:hypothetical protein
VWRKSYSLQAWDDARLRFSNSFAEQQRYGIERLIGSANMFDILPSSAVPSAVPLTEELKAAKEAGGRSEHPAVIAPAKRKSTPRESLLSRG